MFTSKTCLTYAFVGQEPFGISSWNFDMHLYDICYEYLKPAVLEISLEKLSAQWNDLSAQQLKYVTESYRTVSFNTWNAARFCHVLSTILNDIGYLVNKMLFLIQTLW